MLSVVKSTFLDLQNLADGTDGEEYECALDGEKKNCPALPCFGNGQGSAKEVKRRFDDENDTSAVFVTAAVFLPVSGRAAVARARVTKLMDKAQSAFRVTLEHLVAVVVAVNNTKPIFDMEIISAHLSLSSIITFNLSLVSYTR